MDEGILYPESETEQTWESTNGVWQIQMIKDPRVDMWRLENFDAYHLEYPLILDNGNVVFNNPDRLPKYVKKQFLKMVENRRVALESSKET